MTVQGQQNIAPQYTIQGTGPYSIDFDYRQVSTFMVVVISPDSITPLSPDDWSVTPMSGPGGNLFLSTAAASTHDGQQLSIWRKTLAEQGWQGRSGSRELGLEAQLDYLTLALQELAYRMDRSIEIVGPMGAGSFARLEPGRALLAGQVGQGAVVPGPTADEIRNAQMHAQQGAAALQSMLSLFESFADRVLTPKASDPLFDDNGDPLTIGTLYLNTVSGRLRLFTGSVWTDFGADSLSLSGGIMLDFILLHDDPTSPLHPATKQYVDQLLAGKAPSGHNHNAASIVSGQFANERISEASVLQHQAALRLEISAITDLVAALAGKASASHSHNISAVSGLQAALNGKANSGHGHGIGDVSGLSEALTNAMLYADTVAANPARWGASKSSAASANDVAFAAMKNALGARSVDLQGLFWPVTADPEMNIANGGWAIENFDNAQTVLVPAPGFRKRSEIVLEGGARALGWPQGNMAPGFGVLDLGYMVAPGHAPGELGYSVARFTNRGQRLARIISGERFGETTERTSAFAMGITPISLVGGVDYGPHRLVIVGIGHNPTKDARLFAQPLALYDQDAAPGGALYTEGSMFEVTISGNTLAWGIRNAVDIAYGTTTTFAPTLCHGLCIYQAADLSSISFFTGFHSLAGAPAGPYLATVGGSPLDGTASITFVARIGLLNEGVEPLPVWYKNGGSSRLGGFIRSQGIGYPLRFFTTTVGGLNRANVEAADIQDCPAGLDFGTFSNIDACMRPRRKGPNSGWIPTWTTIDGAEDDELHFVFTGKRTRDGSAGKVPVYWGRCTRGSGNFENFWQRAEIELVGYTYFANTNAVSSSNQTGTPGCTFIDADTFEIAFAEEPEAAGTGDHDESFIRKITIDLSGDGYADPAEREIGSYINIGPREVVRIPEYQDYNPNDWEPTLLSTSGGETISYQVNLGTFKRVGNWITATGRIRVDTVSGGGGAARIGGLPFPVVNASTDKGGGVINEAWTFVGNAPTHISALQNSEEMSLRYRNGGAIVELPWSAIQASTEIQFTLTYYTG